ncbi:uncharacterized protein LOC103574569 isoform X2 [Microplitis demolitor]|uniref:uncharacterized protein LOC103574569 isoform X2 n=1 Tax=Microplitis demolitor TaxID=69319 RepID=UPI0004CCF736|nr:uncharacterized protein LOC103574569 isoform X2 [Microplitis demolitor]
MKYCSFFMILIVSIILPSKNESEGFILRDWLYNCLMNRKMTTTSTISTSNSLTGTTISPKIAAFRIRNSVAPFTPSTTNVIMAAVMNLTTIADCKPRTPLAKLS